MYLLEYRTDKQPRNKSRGNGLGVIYHAYEIDKYPIQVAMDNYPDIIQHGDAFAVREDDWKPPQTRSEWLDELLGGDL